jgi:alpha-mannosidase
VEGGHGEVPVATFPAHGFVAVDGVAALLDAVTEYEVLDGRELALTLLRATGRISRDAHPWRADPAGPDLATPAAQLPGPMEASFALMPCRGEPGAAVLEALERYRLPLLAVPASGPSTADLGSAGGLSVDGPGVVMTALRRIGDDLELRLANETGTPVKARVTGPFPGAAETDLMGLPVAGRAGAGLPFSDGRLELAMGPWEIRTLRLLVRPPGAAAGR